MIIHEHGEVIFCKKIIFEDNRIDVKKGHPGIVLLPTNEHNQSAYCLYMTSDYKRKLKNKNMYINFFGESVKKSYVNINQIINNTNNRSPEFDKLEDDDFLEILESFYNYQNSLNPPKEDFLKIKDKIKTLMEIIRFNIDFNITEPVTIEEIEALEKINDSEKIKYFHYVYLTLTSYNKVKDIKKDVFKEKTKQKYFDILIDTYKKIVNIDFDKIDLNDSNNEIRTIYYNILNNYYLLNINSLFKEIVTILYIMNGIDDERIVIVKDFIELEHRRTVEKCFKKDEKDDFKEYFKNNKENDENMVNFGD